MNLASKHLYLAIATAALLLAGCSKKPLRPDPSITILGQRGVGAESVQPPSDIPNAGGPGPGGDLQTRSPFDVNGKDYEALKGSTVYFELNKWDIKPDQRAKLKTAKDYLDKNPGFHLLLEGHCDWRGTAEYNLGLGERRAAAAKKYLVSLGVAADRLETLSKGSLEAAKNADGPTMEKDRRVDLVVVNPKSGGTGI